jgi:hypothetical protein
MSTSTDDGCYALVSDLCDLVSLFKTLTLSLDEDQAELQAALRVATNQLDALHTRFDVWSLRGNDSRQVGGES